MSMTASRLFHINNLECECHLILEGEGKFPKIDFLISSGLEKDLFCFSNTIEHPSTDIARHEAERIFNLLDEAFIEQLWKDVKKSPVH